MQYGIGDELRNQEHRIGGLLTRARLGEDADHEAARDHRRARLRRQWQATYPWLPGDLSDIRAKLDFDRYTVAGLNGETARAEGTR
jgi:hypothetical protein